MLQQAMGQQLYSGLHGIKPNTWQTLLLQRNLEGGGPPLCIIFNPSALVDSRKPAARGGKMGPSWSTYAHSCRASGAPAIRRHWHSIFYRKNWNRRKELGWPFSPACPWLTRQKPEPSKHSWEWPLQSQGEHSPDHVRKNPAPHLWNRHQHAFSLLEKDILVSIFWGK